MHSDCNLEKKKVNKQKTYLKLKRNIENLKNKIWKKKKQYIENLKNKVVKLNIYIYYIKSRIFEI